MYGLKRRSEESRLFDGELIVEVYDWNVSKPDFKIPKEDMKYEDYKRNLTSRIEGLEPKIEDFLAFTTISTPTLGGQSGGVNATLYDSTKSGLPKKVIKQIQLSMPKNMGRICTIKTSFARAR
jgi:hypothetical protein